jgi:hypothetical protein
MGRKMADGRLLGKNAILTGSHPFGCAKDFEGSSPDVFDRESLEDHLMGIYQKPIECFDGAVTLIQFRYVV